MERSSATEVTTVALGVAIAVALLVLGTFVAAPDLLLDEGAKGLAGDQSRIEKARHDIRTSAIQFLGVVGLAVGAYMTLRTLRVTREGQLTDRFTRAIDQLGNSDAVAARVGGIYALERIASQAGEEHRPVMETLLSLVRANAPRMDDRAPSTGRRDVRPPADVQAAITVLGRRDTDRADDELRLTFRNVGLRRAEIRADALRRGGNYAFADFGESQLEGASFHNATLRLARFEGVHAEGADFRGADLSGVDFARAHAEGARFERAHLEHTSFLTAHLDGADFGVPERPPRSLWRAHLNGAQLFRLDLNGGQLQGAELAGAFLIEAQLVGAQLSRAVLRGARLNNADLTDADLRDADLLGASASRDTTWPDDFDFEAAGVNARLPLDLRHDDGRRDLRGVRVGAGGHRESELGNVSRADLRGASFAAANLEGLRFDDAVARGADFTSANLEGASMSRADLRGANLNGANLVWTELKSADLRGATLDGADLSGAALSGATLVGARCTADTIWPEGYDRQRAGVVLAT